MSVPAFIVLLDARDVISLVAAERTLEMVAGNTGPKIMEQAHRVLERLAKRKGARRQ